MNIFEKFWPQAKKEETKKILDQEATPERKSPIPSPEEKILTSESLDAKTEKKLTRGSTGVSFIETERKNMAGIFKTEGYKEERAAYIVDKFLGLNLVPATVIKTHEGKTGSFQQFIPDAKTYYEAEKGDLEGIGEELKKLGIFDFLIGNIDRNEGNFLVKKGGVFAIDHHLAFSDQKYSQRTDDILGEKIPAEIKEKILDFSKWSNGKIILGNLLGELLEKPQINAFFKRFDVLVKCAEKGEFLNRKEFEELKI